MFKKIFKNSLDEIQTVITCTGLDEFIENSK